MKCLTQAEFNVAYLIAMGVPMKQVARRERCSYHTTKHKLRNAYRKLGITCNHIMQLRLFFEKEDI